MEPTNPVQPDIPQADYYGPQTNPQSIQTQQPTKPQKNDKKRIEIILVLLAAVILFGALVFLYRSRISDQPVIEEQEEETEALEVRKFASDEEFKEYLSKGCDECGFHDGIA
jgi:hypothetical protein